MVATCVILLLTAGIAIDFKLMQPLYNDTAVMALEPEGFTSVQALDTDRAYLQNNSLIVTCQLLVISLSSPQGEAQLSRAGVTGNFTVSTVNESNADTPEYPYPYLSISVAAGSPDLASGQLTEAIQAIAANIDDLQASHQLRTPYHISLYTLSDTGPVSQRGSMLRAYGGLIFLALVALFLTGRFLDWRSGARQARSPF